MNLKTKLIILGICLICFLGLGWFSYFQYKQIQNLNAELRVATNNNKAYEAENSALNGKVIAYQLTTEQLTYSKDSLLQKLDQIRKDLKIKDKEIKELQYFASQNRKKDSIFVHDTIFQPNINLDTLIGDKWASVQLHAEYPSTIMIDYSFYNSTAVIAHSSRVTVDPPKKCWLGRLFQKKQTIVEIDVVQENPYCENKETKVIQIIDK